MRSRIPIALTTSRLLLGPVALICAIMGAPRLIYLPILALGTLSDIYDGILARRFHVATPFLRRYDSVTDVVYYLFILAVIWILCRRVLSRTWWAILILLASEAASVIVCMVRFGKYPATHTYFAKFYGFCLVSGLITILAFDASRWVVVTLMSVALITNAEIIAIHLAADGPPIDVPSIFTRHKHPRA